MSRVSRTGMVIVCGIAGVVEPVYGRSKESLPAGLQRICSAFCVSGEDECVC